jgi:CBS domain-containing protein
MTTVRQLLAEKGRHVSTIHPDDTVFNAIGKMADEDIGSLAVMDGSKLVGIITERHYARKVVLKGKTSPTTPVRDIMAKEVIVTQPDRTIEECMAVMTEYHIRHLPVIDGDEVVGIVSIGDLVKSTISSQKFIIDQLVQYIHG